MRPTVLFRAAAVLAVAAVAVSGCSGSGSDSATGGSTSSGETIKIGYIDNSGGAFAANYKTAKAGAEYAIKVINDANGINGVKLELITGDLQNNAGNAPTLVAKLAGANVIAILGAVASGDCLVACAAANKAQVPVIAQGAAAPGVLKDARPYAFAMAAVDGPQSTPVLTKAMKDGGYKTAAIITDTKTSTTVVQKGIYEGVFKDTGMTVTSQVSFSQGDSSFTAQVTTIAGAKPDVLALAAGGDDAGRIAREVQAQGLKVQLIGTSSLQSAGAAFYAAGGSAVEGTISASQYDPQSTDPTASKLLDQAEKDTNQTDIPLNFAYAYDAVGMLVNAIKKSSITPTSDIAQARTAVRDDIQSQGTFTGMAAQTSFKEDGTSVRPQLLAIFKGQNFAIQR